MDLPTSSEHLELRGTYLGTYLLSENYPLQNSISTKLYDTIGQFLLLNEATDIEFDMEKEHELKRFAQLLEINEVELLFKTFTRLGAKVATSPRATH